MMFFKITALLDLQEYRFLRLWLVSATFVFLVVYPNSMGNDYGEKRIQQNVS